MMKRALWPAFLGGMLVAVTLIAACDGRVEITKIAKAKDSKVEAASEVDTSIIQMTIGTSSRVNPVFDPYIDYICLESEIIFYALGEAVFNEIKCKQGLPYKFAVDGRRGKRIHNIHHPGTEGLAVEDTPEAREYYRKVDDEGVWGFNNQPSVFMFAGGRTADGKTVKPLVVDNQGRVICSPGGEP